jgi:hypothetical protein
MAKSFDPFDLPHAVRGERPQPLFDLLRVLTGRGAGPVPITEYLQRWLQSLSEMSRGLDAEGLEGVVPEVVRQAAASLHHAGSSSTLPVSERAALTANLEHLARELASGDWQQTAELIKRIHAARESGSATAAPAAARVNALASQAPTKAVAPEGNGSPVSVYDRARRHLLEHEQEERRRAWLTDRILDQLRSPGSADGRASNPLQSELRLSCPARGRASGRFRISNATDRDLDIELRASPVQGLPSGWTEPVPVRFETSPGRLVAGTDRVIKLTIDVGGCPLVAGTVLELVVDVLGNGQLFHKVWVSIHVTSEV